MKRLIHLTSFRVIASLVIIFSSPSASFSAPCSEGVAEPPFLSYGVDSNLLVLLDNSGSMYDLAYIDATKQCSDNTFDPAETYGGYFESRLWYAYDLGSDQQFESQGSIVPAVCGTADYYGEDGTGNKFVCVDLTLSTTPNTVDAFVATGNFLNWAATSKFDIQKKILTGGKYDSVNQQLQMETRGCLERRFVKQVDLAQTSGGKNYKLVLAVRGPLEVYESWIEGEDYVTGDIVLQGGLLYKANSNDPSSSFDPAISASWDIFKDTRWYPNHAYSANSEVFDTVSQTWYWTQNGGTSLSTATDISGDTNIDWVVYNGTNIELFKITVDGVDLSSCEAVASALTTLDGGADDATKMGQIKADTDDCMGFSSGGGNTVETARKTSFNHVMQECWYYNEFGQWQPGSGTVSSLKNACQSLYDFVSPGDLTPWDSAYICNGAYSTARDKSDFGYVGRCWETAAMGAGAAPVSCPAYVSGSTVSSTVNKVIIGAEQYICSATNYLMRCNKNNCAQTPASKPGDWDVVYSGGEGGGNLDQQWTDDLFYFINPCPYNSCTDNNDLLGSCPDLNDPSDLDYNCTVGGDVWTCQEIAGDGDNITDSCYIADPTGDMCVEQAIKDFCNIINVPEIIDPSDSTNLTGEVWNAPAYLTDGAVLGQMEAPLVTMYGRIEQTTAPSGLIQEFASDIRIGIMKFNDNGASTECASYGSDPTDPITYDCPASGNQDGGQITTEIDQGAAHTTSLVSSINDIRADSWTPLAEAMFNALGYYAQKDTWRLNADDFTVGPDPIQQWCQDNHIVIITEGQSTADVNSTVVNFVTSAGDVYNDGGTADDIASLAPPTCGDNLYGSTYLDDLTYFASHAAAADFYSVPQLESTDKREITTHIVIPGTPRTVDTTGTVAECSPETLVSNAADNGTKDDTDSNQLHQSSDVDGLEANLREVFSEIRSGASAGSAASVISSSRGGEGAIYQAIFWKEVDESSDALDEIDWVGDVHALHISSEGYMYEDTDDDRVLSAGDQRVIIYFDESVGKSKGCYADLVGDTCPAVSQVELPDVKYLWSANDWLAKISLGAGYTPYNADDVFHNRSSYISGERRRYIFTWLDLDNDGIVDSTSEIKPFVDRNPGDGSETMDWAAMSVSGGRGAVPYDFNATSNAEVNAIVRWIRGFEEAGKRSRQITVDLNKDGTTDDVITWRLGDVIHSTPMAVAGPAEGFHLLYRDGSYADFVVQYQSRRHVVYFGGNDGMLHAVNGGFYNESMKKFCLTSDCDETDVSNEPELGAELWAYVPTNLLPHLKCLTGVGYDHKYYVDQRPRIFDARIFPAGVDANGINHPNGWGTILVGAMRFGGAKVNAADLNGDAADTRQFTSSYFIFDITDPEHKPTLLAEMTKTTSGTEVDLGYTTPIPTMVIMKNGNDFADYKWYLLFGSGPACINDATCTDPITGVSDQTPRVSVLPLDWIVDQDPFDAVDPRIAFRIPDSLPSELMLDPITPEGGTFELSASANGFVSDLITVDFDLESNYMSDAVYFGTIEGSAGSWAGKMYRLVTREEVSDSQVPTTPSQWYGLLDTDGVISPVADPLNPAILHDAGQPVTASAAVGTDGGNFWVYFGTGRFLTADDKTDSSDQFYYGIKEPTECRSPALACDEPLCWKELTWETVEKTGTQNGTPGDQGLLQVDQILVQNSSATPSATLSCIDGTTNCLSPSGAIDFSTFAELENYIVGEGCLDTDPTGTDGWYKELLLDRERNLGQATLLGGLLTFTTYQPFSSACQSEGLGFLYADYYQTGTSWIEPIFGEPEGLDADNNVVDILELGRGLSTTPNLHVGKDSEGPTAFVQTSTGEIKRIPQLNLPLKNYKTGKKSWQEYLP